MALEPNNDGASQPALEDISPCIGVCTLNREDGHCMGCFRSMDEIRNWWKMSPQARMEIMELLPAREALIYGD
jgi:uncharacterized protein